MWETHTPKPHMTLPNHTQYVWGGWRWESQTYTSITIHTKSEQAALSSLVYQNQMETHMALKWPPEWTSPNRKYNPIQNATPCDIYTYYSVTAKCQNTNLDNKGMKHSLTWLCAWGRGVCSGEVYCTLCVAMHRISHHMLAGWKRLTQPWQAETALRAIMAGWNALRPFIHACTGSICLVSRSIWSKTLGEPVS